MPAANMPARLEPISVPDAGCRRYASLLTQQLRRGSAAISTDPVTDDPGVSNDGTVDADGNCYGAIEIFSGRALRCRPAGLLTTFSNCCRNRGTIVKDGMGSSLTSISTKIAVAKGVLTGMKAAYTAFKAGATASRRQRGRPCDHRGHRSDLDCHRPCDQSGARVPALRLRPAGHGGWRPAWLCHVS
jgi:hypothetical protein